jgi:ATP-dependent 26S proteasome regulatory subunit
MIYFAMPRPEQRLQLWRKAFASLRLEAEVDWRRIADEFELAGGAIINVLRYASLMALRREVDIVSLHDIRQGIRREFRKDGKVV